MLINRGVMVIVVAIILSTGACAAKRGPKGAAGQAGAMGAQGEQGIVGASGATGVAGSSCSVEQTELGALISCTDGSSALVLHGAPGKAGKDAEPKSGHAYGHDKQDEKGPRHE